jgi:hypothetical protein
MVTAHETMHQRLQRNGARSIQLAHRNYAFSPFNSIVSAGAEVIPHRTLPEALVHLRDVLVAAPDRTFINLYWAGLDTAAHLFGPNSPVHEAEVAAFWATLDTLLANIDDPDTLFFFTADHGQIGVDAADTLYINESMPELAGCLATWWRWYRDLSRRMFPGSEMPVDGQHSQNSRSRCLSRTVVSHWSMAT